MKTNDSSKKIDMTPWIIVPIMGIVWLVALLYTCGIGMQYDVYNKLKMLVIAFFFVQTLINKSYKCISKKAAFVILVIFSTNIITQVLYGKNMFDYLWLYLLIPVISYFPVYDKPMKWVSVMYGALGMVTLFFRNFGAIFDGWNANSIAMIAFFSFSVMIVSFNKTKNIGIFLLLAVYFAVYYTWSESLNSRSGALFTIIMILGVLDIIPFRKWFQKKWCITLLLCVPLIVAIFIVIVRNTDIFQSLDSWSYATFDKPIFNSRDEICKMGFEKWRKHPIIGIGDLSAYNWHNSAVTVLVGGGIVGFLIWIFGTQFIIKKGIPYLKDNIVFGLMLGFIAIWLQQSVELGLVAAQANAIPYAMLGLLVGRVRTLRRQEHETFNNRSGL